MAEGYVQKDSGRTARVTLLRPDDIGQMFELRLPLEVLAARLAALRKPDLTELDQTISDMQSAIECRNIRAIYDRDIRFHMLICEVSGNRYLAAHVRRLIVPLFAFSVIRAHHGLLDDWHASLVDHRRVLDAIRTGDPDAAEREVVSSMKSFLQSTQRRLSGA
jgi:DNA-binding GntR family transcriptional regulator